MTEATQEPIKKEQIGISFDESELNSETILTGTKKLSCRWNATKISGSST
jgi:hypothetical protein